MRRGKGRGAVDDRLPSSSTVIDVAEHPAAAPASVLVEVGNGNGALVLVVDDSFRDREIEISRVGSTARVHTGVLERCTAAGAVLAAVFGSLPAGRYVVWGDEQAALDEVVIASGGVTEWPDAALTEAQTSR